MKLLHTIRCRFDWHHWGPVTSDAAGAHHQCTYCGKVKSFDSGGPPINTERFGSQWHGGGGS